MELSEQVELTLHEQLEDPPRDIYPGIFIIIFEPEIRVLIEVKVMVTVEVSPMAVLDMEAEAVVMVESAEVKEMVRVSIWK